MNTIQTSVRNLVVALCVLAGNDGRVANVSGQWRAEFDTAIGPQKYLFTFQTNDGKVVAKATAELGDQNGRSSSRTRSSMAIP